jgi:hypothetical protein
MSPDTTPPDGIKLLPGKMPETKTLDEWLAALPAWLQELIELTPAQRKQRLDDQKWYGAPEGFGIPKLRRKIIRGDWAGLKVAHEEEVRATQRARQTQFVLPPAACNPGSRPPSGAEAQAFAKIWAAQAAGERTAFEIYGFPEHPKILKRRSPLPAGVFTFKQFVEKGLCDYTRLGWFLKSLRHYPFFEDGLITEIGYKVLRDTQKNARKAGKLESAKKLREADAPTKQVPEPKKRRRKVKKP